MGLIIPNSFANKTSAQLSDLDENFTYLQTELDPYIDNILVDESGQVTIGGGVVADLTGNVTGNVTGNLLGNVTGDVTGNVSGNAGTVTNGVYTTGNQTIGGTKTFSNTIVGTIDLSTNCTNAIGYNQTWQGVTRVMGTTYTNDTGKPIMLVARADRSGVSTSGIGISFNGGGVIPICYGTNSNGGNTAVGSIIVPVGATYVLSVISESLTSYSIWELR